MSWKILDWRISRAKLAKGRHRCVSESGSGGKNKVLSTLLLPSWIMLIIPSFFYVSLFLKNSSPPIFLLHLCLLSPAQRWVSVMNVNGCWCQIRWDDVYGTQRRRAGVRAASLRSSFRQSPRQTHVTERLSVRDDQSAIQARAVQQPGISFFFRLTPRDQSEAPMWLCCHGKHDRDVKKCQTG